MALELRAVEFNYIELMYFLDLLLSELYDVLQVHIEQGKQPNNDDKKLKNGVPLNTT